MDPRPAQLSARGRAGRMSALLASRRASAGALFFDLLLIVFAGALVVASLGLRSGAGLVPLVIGIPTLGMALVQLGLDLRGQPATPPSEGGIAVGGDASIGDLVAAAAREKAEDFQVDTSPEARRRQALFALWCVAFVVVADLTSFYVAVVGGLVILFAAIRLRPIPAVATILGSVLALWGLFDQFLGVRF
jgi:hypothetical protein